MSSTRGWRGPPALASLLVPIASLEPWPGNPNRGDVPAIRRSLARFGQLKPVVVSGSSIVAGHHVVLAAAEEGWTHVAAAENVFESEDEARAYLLADNRTAQLSVIDDALLHEQLRALRENSTLAGTGYTDQDAADLEASLAKFRNPPVARPPGDVELPLLIPAASRRDFENYVEMLEREWQTPGLSAVVLRAVREAAAAL